MPIAAAYDALRELAFGPEYTTLPVRRVLLGSAVELDIAEPGLPMARRHLASFAPAISGDTLHLVPAPAVSPTTPVFWTVASFGAGCIVGAAVVAAPLTVVAVVLASTFYTLYQLGRKTWPFRAAI